MRSRPKAIILTGTLMFALFAFACPAFAYFILPAKRHSDAAAMRFAMWTADEPEPVSHGDAPATKQPSFSRRSTHRRIRRTTNTLFFFDDSLLEHMQGKS